MRLFDTNVLIDVFADDRVWAPWSKEAIAAGLGGTRLINIVVYAELSAAFARLELLEAELARLGIAVANIPTAAAFRAGQAHAAYRRAGGSRSRVLPDFIIGAHAAELGVPLVTRDPRRYRTYFPDLTLVSPDD